MMRGVDGTDGRSATVGTVKNSPVKDNGDGVDNTAWHLLCSLNALVAVSNVLHAVELCIITQNLHFLTWQSRPSPILTRMNLRRWHRMTRQ